MYGPSLERDAVCLQGLRRRADLNDHYALVQRRLTPVMYEVRVGRESIVAKYANFRFVGDSLPSVALGTTSSRHVLVLDAEMRAKYVGDLVVPTRVAERMNRLCVHQSRDE